MFHIFIAFIAWVLSQSFIRPFDRRKGGLCDSECPYCKKAKCTEGKADHDGPHNHWRCTGKGGKQAVWD